MTTQNKSPALFSLIGILGGLLLCYGLICAESPAKPYYYAAGSFLMLVTAINFRILYFIVLEVILLSGHGSALLKLSPVISVSLPILLCIQLIIYYLLSKTYRDFYLFIGVIGIAIISIGFIVNNQLVFLIGSSFISLYAFFLYCKGIKIALLWATVNAIFALVALVKLGAVYT